MESDQKALNARGMSAARDGMAELYHRSSLRPQESLRFCFWVSAVLLGLLQIWVHRYQVGPDGTSYIEIARRLQHGDYQALLNGYWSPLYPLLLSGAFRILDTGLYWESTVVHFLNFAIYLGSLYCFEIFLKQLLAARKLSGHASGESHPENLRRTWIWGYLLFLWVSWFWTSPAEVTPDLLVVCVVFLATAALLRIRTSVASWGTFAILGVILGAGYLAKAAMFPIAFVFLVSAFSLARSRKRAELPILISTVTFVAVTAPFLLALSQSKGRITFGDTGKLNYAWYVSGAPKSRHWQGQPSGTGVPVHPTRRVSDTEPLYEFAEPVQGSYPPWYDPSYWYEGVKPQFDAKGQLMALYRAANSYLRIWSKYGTMYFVGLAILLLRRRGAGWREAKDSFYLVWMPTYAALLMYELVHVEPRFVGGFGLVLLAAAFTRLAPPVASAGGGMKLPGFLMIAAPALAIAWGAIGDIRLVMSPKPFEQWNVAQNLDGSGISPGARVGAIGMGLDAYWSHLAEVRIIAEIPEHDEGYFANADKPGREKILEKFAELGASALVTDKPAVAESADGWQSLGSGHYYVYKLDPRKF